MSTPTVHGQSWDTFDGYLFDIDGTLLNCTDTVHYFAFCHTLQAIAGRPLDLSGVTAHGNTDIGILRDAFARAGVPGELWRPRLAEIRETMCSFVTAHAGDLQATPVPGVFDILRHLRGRGAKLGIATGNLREIGQLKLRRAGLLDYFEVGGWSDAHERRSEVFAAAVQLMRAATHRHASICVVGDTPADVLAAHDNALPIIAVATGIYSLQELNATAPDLCLQSLADLLQP